MVQSHGRPHPSSLNTFATATVPSFDAEPVFAPSNCIRSRRCNLLHVCPEISNCARDFTSPGRVLVLTDGFWYGDFAP